MITYKYYRHFLEVLADAGIRSCCVKDLIIDQAVNGKLAIKHDVESNLKRALLVGRIEAAVGHRASYYLQGELMLNEASTEIVAELVGLGHEVAYHYDVLDASNGCYAAAVVEFDRYKSIIESLTGESLKTVCPHGNPTKLRSGWRSNKDFFRSEKVRTHYREIVDIVVDFESLFPNGVFISDAGMRLRRIRSVGENDATNMTAISDGEPIDWAHVAEMVAASNGTVVSLHTHRFRQSKFLLSIYRLRLSMLRYFHRKLSSVPTIKRVCSKFYKITKYL